MLAVESAAESGPTLAVYIGALVAVLGAVATAYGVYRNSRTDHSRISREEFTSVNEALGTLTDRWQAEAQRAWKEIERLQTKVQAAEERADHAEARATVADARSSGLLVKVTRMEHELVETRKGLDEARRECKECHDRLSELEHPPHEG